MHPLSRTDSVLSLCPRAAASAVPLSMAYRSEYAEVPDVEPDAAPDALWRSPRGVSQLSAAYLPPSMPGPQTRWRKGAAWVLITMLITVTGGGICLTYGPAELFSRLSG